jgi:serpin B
LVPDAGSFDRFAQSLGAARLDEIVKGLAPTYVDLSLPKFTVAGNLPLANELKAAGMVDAFDPARADFSAIAPNLYISAAFHQAKLILDETGTEAAAATAFVGSVTSAPPTPTRVVVDRPFLFLLRDTTGAVLFMGQFASSGG